MELAPFVQDTGIRKLSSFGKKIVKKKEDIML
jgi:hypothetical protein